MAWNAFKLKDAESLLMLLEQLISIMATTAQLRNVLINSGQITTLFMQLEALELFQPCFPLGCLLFWLCQSKTDL